MSISNVYNQNKQTSLKRETSLAVINVRQAIGKLFKAIPGNTIDFILIFCYITTALGELFGRKYGFCWYSLLIILLAVFLVKELLGLKIKPNS